MSDTVSVIVASYGDKTHWDALADRALQSIKTQIRPPEEIHRIHGNTLHEARNEGARRAGTDWLCFLDCDDELEPEYLYAMMEGGSPLELRYPRVRHISPYLIDITLAPEPVHLHARPIERGNYMVVGTLVRRDLFWCAEGFRDIPAYEDWDLWIRCWMLGADPRLIMGAVYRVHRRNGSRNSLQTSSAHGACSEIIRYNREWQYKRKKLCSQ